MLNSVLIHKKLPLHLKGGSLVYALMIVLFVALLLTGVLMSFHYQRILQIQLLNREIATENVVSANIFFLNKDRDRMGIMKGNLFGAASSPFEVRAELWGIFGIATTTASYKQASATRVCLFGIGLNDVLDGALYLSDKNKPLKVVGKTRLVGTCYLPITGVSAGYVGQKTFEGRTYVEGEIKKSKLFTPNLQYRNLQLAYNDLITALNKVGEQKDTPTVVIQNQSFLYKWTDSVHKYILNGDLGIQNIHSTGKCKFIGTNSLTLYPNNPLQHAIVMAPTVRIKKGFTGCIQVFATDSIIVEEGVVLSYPSALVLSAISGLKPSVCVIRNNAVIEGTLIHSNQILKQQVSEEGYTLIGEGSKVKGNVVANGKVELRGTIEGNLIVGEFVLNTPSSVYTNYLMDAYIDRKALPSTFTTGIYLSENPNYRMIQWLTP